MRAPCSGILRVARVWRAFCLGRKSFWGRAGAELRPSCWLCALHVEGAPPAGGIPGEATVRRMVYFFFFTFAALSIVNYVGLKKLSKYSKS